ncbi:hypothetical protein SKAU_G00074640 [Synaphobranchus kaupii]|uniref:Uncharacterized protein n=1 Tax=Synaphobranchus kaupii TaxID=118154 RepID=A0A9Q1G8K7_SYNKA|nr:hypothetical protein SKAU_G00074640 [Synaphobranchus kaupii]
MKDAPKLGPSAPLSPGRPPPPHAPGPHLRRPETGRARTAVCCSLAPPAPARTRATLFIIEGDEQQSARWFNTPYICKLLIQRPSRAHNPRAQTRPPYLCTV